MIEIFATSEIYYPELPGCGMNWTVVIDDIIVAAFRNSHDAIEFAWNKIQENE